MPLTLGTTGMDNKTEADVRAAFNAANDATGGQWSLVEGDTADFVAVDMDSLYGPMSWLRLHAAGRKVIGLSSTDRTQTDYRLARPVDADAFATLLRQLGADMPLAPTAVAPVVSTPAPAPTDHLPEPQAMPADEVEAIPVEAPAMAIATAAVATPEPEPQVEALEPVPAASLPPDRPLASWLAANGLERRVRLQRDDGPALLLDPGNKVYHGPATLKPLAAYFDGTLQLEDFATPDPATWDSEAAALGTAQPLARLQWLGGLLAEQGALGGQYQLTKWPQTEREYPKHFRIATAMMKGPCTVDEVVEACGVDRAEVTDFFKANLATGYAEPVLPPAPEMDTPAKPGGLFGRMRGR